MLSLSFLKGSGVVAANLSNDFRREQTVIAEQVTYEMLAVFGALNFKALDMSSPGFIEAAVSVAERGHRQSVALGGDMYLSMRRDAGVMGNFRVDEAVFDPTQLRRDLVALGPVAAKKLLSRGERIPDAASRVFTLTSGRVSKSSIAGARDTISRSTVSDDRAVAYARQVGSNPCDFCSMLSANTYKSAYAAMYSAGGRKRAKAPQPLGATFHDHCKCTLVTLFGGELPDPAKGEQEFLKSWVGASKQGVDFRTFADSAGVGLAV